MSSGPESRRQQILDTAAELFAARGFHWVSVADLGAAVGISGPGLYKHFAGKDELALHLFETCHARVWTMCADALSRAQGFDGKVDAYVACWLELTDEYPDVLAFLSDSARTLWPRSSPVLHRKTMIGLARSLVLEAPRVRDGEVDPDAAAASVQGTLAELGRMIQVGVVQGPARQWHGRLVALFGRLFG